MRALTKRIKAIETSWPGVVSDASDKAFKEVFDVLWAMQEGRGASGITALAAHILADNLTDGDRHILGTLPAGALAVLGHTAAEYVAELAAILESGKV